MTHRNFILIGPPGSGKGTQAARLGERYGIPTISTGETLRAAAAAHTPIGCEVQTVITAGGLVKDALMIDLMRARLAQPDAARGFVLDGFPRTIGQAVALDRLFGGEVFAIVLFVPDAEVVRRLSARRVCNACGTPYTVGSQPAEREARCLKCHAPLVRRDDDTTETILRRLATYRDTIEPVIDHYHRRPGFALIDGTGLPDAVSAAIASHLDDRTRVAGTASPASIGL